MDDKTLFDIFDYLGIEVTEDLEFIQRKLDDLNASQMADLRKKPAFTKIRGFLYAKRANSAFYDYVQQIRQLRGENQQRSNTNNNNNNYNNNHNTNNTDKTDNKTEEQKNSEEAGEILGGIIFFIIMLIFLPYINTSTTPPSLSSPEPKISPISDYEVRVTWEPVQNASHYVLETTDTSIPEGKRRKSSDNNQREIVINRFDHTVSYTLTAFSTDKNQYSPSQATSVTVGKWKNEPSFSNEASQNKLNEPTLSGQNETKPLLDDTTPLVQNVDTISSNSSPNKIILVEALQKPVLDVSEFMGKVYVKWEPIPNAKYYILDVQIGKDGKKYSKVINELIYIFDENKLKKGKTYYFSLSVVPEDETLTKMSKSEVIEFTVEGN